MAVCLGCQCKTLRQMILATIVHKDKGDQMPEVGVEVERLWFGWAPSLKSLRGGWMGAAEATTM